MTCSHCALLAHQNAELRDEIAAWRALDSDDRSDAEAEARLMALRTALPMNRGPAKALLTLIDRAGAPVGFDALAHSRSEDVNVSNIAKSYICQARAALKRAELDVAIECIWGFGYRIDRTSAATLRATIESRKPGDATEIALGGSDDAARSGCAA